MSTLVSWGVCTIVWQGLCVRANTGTWMDSNVIVTGMCLLFLWGLFCLACFWVL